MANRPVTNPVITLLKAPTPKSVQGGGKSAKGIKESLEQKRDSLSKKVKKIHDSDLENYTFGGVTHLLAKMDDDALSPSWTPSDLFDSKSESRIISPAYQGFLIEISRANLPTLYKQIKNSTNINDQVDISRIASIDIFDESETLRGSSIEELWTSMPNDGGPKPINVWLKPFKNKAARKGLITKIKGLLKERSFAFGHPEFDSSPDPSITHHDALEDVIENYLVDGYADFSLYISTRDDLERLVSSGAVYRIEAAPNISVSHNPGTGKEPSPKLVSIDSPTVVIIDGGVNASSYLHLEKMSLNPLVPFTDANIIHGNKVASLVCHAHAWNNNRRLPSLDCTYISAQVICKDSAPKTPNHDQLIRYLEEVAKLTSEHAKVWNLSFNTVASLSTKDEVSRLGHRINKIARKYGILPVISAGNNYHNPHTGTLCPPADCESSLTISGRIFNLISKKPGKKCSLSLKGPAPAGMKKPDLAWYSELRVLGGKTEKGTSFSTPLVSSLAAHTFANIKNPTPDLVKALLINRGEIFSHNNELGWGTPWQDEQLPWHCPLGSVTLAWTSKLQPGFYYYWNDIPIPPEMIDNGKFIGTVALTAVLKPLISESVGENYFSSRLQVALQAISKSGSTINLAGNMKEDKEKEAIARAELSKWSPVRNHYKSHSGTGVTGTSMKLCARIFTRDLYQFDMSHHSELPPQEVAFVLTLRAHDGSESIYDSAVSAMKSEIESAVVNQDIHVS